MNVLYGTFEKMLFRDDKTGFSIFSLKVPASVVERDNYGNVRVKGKIVTYAERTPIRAEGEWEIDAKGQLVFNAGHISEEASDKTTAIQYLCSLSGIGAARAEAIVRELGVDFNKKLRGSDGPDLLKKACKGITQAQAEDLCGKINATRAERELFEYIVQFGGSFRTASKIFKDLGTGSLQMLKESPYKIGGKYGLTFLQCDEIANQEGVAVFDRERLFSAMQTALKNAETDGDVYMTMDAFLSAVQKLLDKKHKIPSALIMSLAEMNKNISLEKDFSGIRVYNRYLLNREIGIAVNIARLNRTAKDLPFKEELIDEIQDQIGVKYARQQREAFDSLYRTGVHIVTGGPGTGKTTVINGIIRAYERICPEGKILCCAPTGRASQRMKESTGKDAVTVHRALNYRPFGNDVTYKTHDDPIDADFVIMDEASMLDTEIASMFLDAIKDGALVLFVGDVDQLQAVGPGDVLHSMIFSERIDTHRLTDVYRQASTSPIVQNATKINFGETDMVEDDDFVIMYRALNEFPEDIIDAVKKFHDPSDPFSAQVLTPTHKGDAGVKNLNKILQEMLNPQDPEGKKAEKRYGGSVFREGDKVVLLNNNYAVGYHNGDIGIINGVDANSVSIDIIGGTEITLSGDGLDDLALAYAMTVHKSQGSEFKTVILALPYLQIMLKRNLLYTAITRAKKRISIISEPGAIDVSIAADETGKRNSRLKERIRSVIE